MVIIVKQLLENIKNFSLLVLGVFCLLGTGCSKQLYQYSAPTEAQHYPLLKYTLIELIDALPKSMPTTMVKAQVLFNNQLYLESENKNFIFYDSKPFITKDGVIITDISVNVRKDHNFSVTRISMGFDQKQCVSTKFLNKKFDLHIISLLTPHKLNNPLISYSIRSEKRSLGVSTILDNKNCALSLGVYK